jgi:predicted site-specific integrase-resolvase
MDTYNPGRAAQLIGVSYYTLRRWWLAGRIPTVVLPSGFRRIPAWWVREQLAQVETVARSGTQAA